MSGLRHLQVSPSETLQTRAGSSTHLCLPCTAGCPASWMVTGACFWPPMQSRGACWWTCFRVVELSFARMEWRRAERVSASEDGTSERQRRRKRMKDDGGVEGERCSIDTGREGYRWSGDGCSLRICFVCVLRAYEQGYPDGLFRCGAAEHLSAANQAPPSWAAAHTRARRSTVAMTTTEWAHRLGRKLFVVSFTVKSCFTPAPMIFWVVQHYYDLFEGCQQKDIAETFLQQVSPSTFTISSKKAFRDPFISSFRYAILHCCYSKLIYDHTWVQAVLLVWLQFCLFDQYRSWINGPFLGGLYF